MIRHENSDPCLTTYWNISKKQRSPNFINRLMSSCASSRVHCRSAWISQQTHHMASTLKRRGNDRFHAVSTWNPRGVFVDLIWQYMENKQIKWRFKFWFRCGKSPYLYDFDTHLGKKGNTEFGLGESVILWLCESVKTPVVILIMPISLLVPRLLQSS